LRRCLKTTSDCADVMWNERSFHMLAPATGNARLPTRVEQAALLDDERKKTAAVRRLDVMSATWRHGRKVPAIITQNDGHYHVAYFRKFLLKFCSFPPPGKRRL